MPMRSVKYNALSAGNDDIQTSTSQPRFHGRAGGPIDAEAERLINTKDSFHELRWRCIWDPDRAKETLDDCAEIKIGVKKARNLVDWDSADNAFAKPKGPYVEIYLNDTKKEHSSQGKGCDPVWNYDAEMTFLLQMSMVTIIVIDDQLNNIGFIDLCLGDIPWNTPIEGWFEVRFAEKFHGTSIARYAQHRKRRDDSEKDAEHTAREAAQREFSGPVPHNAGEIYLSLLLQPCNDCSRLDTALALVFAPPVAKNQAKQDMGWSSPKAKRKKGAGVDAQPALQGGKQDKQMQASVQKLGDHLVDLKLALHDQALCCTRYFFTYILRWRRGLLSGPIGIGLITMYLLPVLRWILGPLLIAFVHVLLGCSALRKDMTVGGRNAPFSQSGFEQVAKWRDSLEMRYFLQRVVETDLQGLITDQRMFESVAARCFSNGIPKVSYDELRRILKQEKFIRCTNGGELEAGDLVMVNGEQKATILYFLDSHDAGMMGAGMATAATATHEGMAFVRFEDEARLVANVPVSTLMPRPEMPTLPGWAIPQGMLATAVKLEQKLQGMRHKWVGAQSICKGIVTWSRVSHAILFLLFMLSITAFNVCTRLGMWDWLWEKRDYFNSEFANHLANPVQGGFGWAHDRWTHFKGFCRWSVGWLLFAIFVIWYIYRAQWLNECYAVCRLGKRYVTGCRSAPKGWPFYKAA